MTYAINKIKKKQKKNKVNAFYHVVKNASGKVNIYYRRAKRVHPSTDTVAKLLKDKDKSAAEANDICIELFVCSKKVV